MKKLACFHAGRRVRVAPRLAGACILLLVAAAPAAAQTVAPPQSGVVAPPALTTPPGGVAAPQALTQPPAQAAPQSECERGISTLQQKRQTQLESINNLVKGKKKQIDPVAACPLFRRLVVIEKEMKDWVVKNKDWCSIPDQFVESMDAGFAKTPVFAKRACAAAEMVKRGGPAGGGPVQAQPAVKLPSGPL